MQTLFCAFLIYIGIMFVVIYCKPKLMYDHENKRHRPFGTAENATLFPTWMCAVVVAVASYLGSLVVCSPAFAPISTSAPLSQPTTDQPSVLPPPMRRATVGGRNDSGFRPQHYSHDHRHTSTITHHPSQNCPHHHHPHHHHHNNNHQQQRHHSHHYQSFAHPQHHDHHTHYRAPPPSHVGASRVWKHAMS